MENTLKLSPVKRRDRAYYRQRQKNRVFTELVQFVADEAERRGITKRELAEVVERDPAQITRWLSAPSNFELDTLSDILLALGAEMDHRIVRFSDRAKPNDVHPLVVERPQMTVEIGHPKPLITGPNPRAPQTFKFIDGQPDLKVVEASIAVAEQ
ncbi:MAG: helix-turn-helix transcriptional regulator [Anaerolineales bacterium]|nr:helix-turn-helix transcriptional regulator [Anaerolineales bacterium]